MGKSRHPGGCPPSRGFRPAGAFSRGRDCRAAPRAARARPGGDQASGGQRRRARLQPVRIRPLVVRPVPRRVGGLPRGCRNDRRRSTPHWRHAADLRFAHRSTRRARGIAARGATPSAFERRCIPAGCVAPPSNIADILGRRALPSGRLAVLGATMELHHGLLAIMRFVTTTGSAPPVSFTTALFDGLAPDGGLYVPERIEPWTPDELARLPRRTLTEIGLRAMRPFTRGQLDPAVLEAVIVEALNVEIALVEVERGVHALELFHGPTLAFKDVGARVMARVMASLHLAEDPLTVLVATSGDTGSAVAHAFHRVPHTRVVILYPDGRISPTQEAQLTMFNGERANVRAYAVAGSFDDCHRLTREAFGDPVLRTEMRLTSANSVNVGRLLPQSIYYFHAVAQLGRTHGSAPTSARSAPMSVGADPRVGPDIIFSTPSGNFGNLTAGLMAKRAGLAVAQFVAATNVNDVVPEYLATGRYAPRASVRTMANAMDVGHPSNFERMSWLYGGDRDAMRHDVIGVSFTDNRVRETIRQVFETRGYLLDPHSAIAYLGLVGRMGEVGQVGQAGRAGVFLATAHPAKFAEIVEPIIGRKVEKPEPLAQALGQPRHIIRIDAALDAVKTVLHV